MTSPCGSDGVDQQERTGPLRGLRVIEIGSIGPGPFAAMLLADHGAEVLRIDRLSAGRAAERTERGYVMHRGRRSACLDLQREEGVQALLTMVESADVLLEGFRPGVAERLGFGPEECLRRNPNLVYARITGWGQQGPRAHTAGHDINYLAMSGALHAIGRRGEAPVPPVNLLGDYGSGGMLVAFGIVCAVLAARASGRGQIVDAAIVDGAAMLTTVLHALKARGEWRDTRGVNLLDSGAHFYEVYETADGHFLSVGALEEKFYAELIERLGLQQNDAGQQEAHWAPSKARFAQVIRTKTSDEWAAIFAGSDACVAPVLSLAEAAEHPDNLARQTFITVDGVVQPAPAPRFSDTPAGPVSSPPRIGEHTIGALADWGVPAEDLAALQQRGIVYQRPADARNIEPP